MNIFENVSLSNRRPHGRRIYELLWKAKIELHLFKQYFTPPTPLPKQGESKTTLCPDIPSTRILRSTIPFRKYFKSCSPVSDLVTRNGPQVTTRFTCLVIVPIEHEPFNQNVGKKKRKNNRNICVTRISNLANGAKINFETYN